MVPHRLLAPVVLAAALAAPSDVYAAGPPAVETLALINAARARYGAPALRADPRLERAARRHSRDMVAHRYFAHDSRSGARFSARIARVGWMRGRARWRVGEDLAWGTGRAATPRAVLAAWLHSPAHRRVLLRRSYRVVGVGVAAGTPKGRAGRTYTADFGS
jgi:uncharacterized protein YkwD